MAGTPIASALRVGLVVLAVYAAWIAAFLGAGNDMRDLIGLGRIYLHNGNVNVAFNHPGVEQIRAGGHRPASRTGYDGQFSYYIAVSPRYGRFYMDDASLRYTRILQPMAARLLAVGDEDVIPYTLFLLNWLAAGLGTFFVASWLQARGVSRWYALLYGLFPGIFVGVQRDLTEPVAYALVALGLLLFDDGRRSRLAAAGVAFGLAGLARQTTLIFPLVLGLWLAFSGPGWRRALALIGLSVGPYLAYVIFLRSWLGSLSDGDNLSPVPFLGLFHQPWLLDHQGVTLVFVIVPTVIALIALMPPGTLRSRRWLPWFLIAANACLAIVFFGKLYTATYTSTSRVATGILLSCLLCLPYVERLSARRQAWLMAAAAIGVVAPSLLISVQGFASLSA